MKKKIRWPLYVIAALIVTFLAFVVPLPYYIEVPGGSEDIRQVLKVNDTEDKEAGAYQFVTVGGPTCYFSSYDLCLVDTFYRYS
ncbi:ATP-dependent protease La [Streptococcus pneumoniae]|nr:ATP-dependent protease La [Streptococcus pneumoniae]